MKPSQEVKTGEPTVTYSRLKFIYIQTLAHVLSRLPFPAPAMHKRVNFPQQRFPSMEESTPFRPEVCFIFSSHLIL